MPRIRRPYLPGTLFHVATRTINKTRWFEPEVRDAIVSIIGDALLRSDTLLLAYVIMSNHLHLFMRQGAAPLGTIMHVIKRRIAAVLKRRLEWTGGIFEKPYYAFPCSDPQHARA